jgi:AcrR family transcriptional regulator
VAIKERIRIGGRSARIQGAVHAAVNRLSASTPREDLTVPQIAAEAGVTPSTIYRRWGDLGALLADVAVARLRPIADPEDTGAMASDLRVFIEQFAEEMSSPVGRALIKDVLSPSEDSYPCTCASFTRDHLATIAERAKARGETPFEVDDVVDHVVAPIIYRILFDDRELAVDYCHALLNRLSPAAAAPPPRADPITAPQSSKGRTARGRAPRIVPPKKSARR